VGERTARKASGGSVAAAGVVFGLPSMVTRALTTLALVVVASLAVLMGYRFARASVAAEVYRDRLTALASEHAALRDRYNDAVRRSAVTELVVDRGTLTVRVRSGREGGGGGVLREVRTPFDPSGEIYVDYAVLDGRLWIRRVFDDKTPPSAGLVIDPELSSVDWGAGEGGGLRVGKAVYRSLSDGRWVVSVTGQGSLGLTRVGPVEAAAAELMAAPEVREFDEITGEADRAADAIGWREVWGWVRGGR